MKCVNCGAELINAKNFCTECGAKIEKKKFCTECGAELKPGQKFCGNCGTKVESSGPEPELQKPPVAKKNPVNPNAIFIDMDEIIDMTDEDDSVDGEIYEKAQAGDPVAMYALVHNYRWKMTERSCDIGIENISNDYEYQELDKQVSFWLEQAAKHDVVNAQVECVRAFDAFMVNGSNSKKAFFWYKKVLSSYNYEDIVNCNSGNPLHITVDKNILEEAIKIAEENQDAELFVSIGEYYQYDKDENPECESYTEDALYWHKKAAALGNKRGKEYLEMVENYKDNTISL